MRELGLRSDEVHFWATHAHAELDLLTFVGGRRIGFEAKRADAPGISKSMRIALEDLKLRHLYVVYPGAAQVRLDERITLLGPSSLTRGLAGLRHITS